MNLRAQVEKAVELEPAFRQIISQFDHPPRFSRPPGFQSLLHIILEQQVSLASARAVVDKLLVAVDGRLTPAKFLQFDDGALKAFGFSRQKARYGRILAEALLTGDLDLDALPALSDDDARAALTALTGIGPWTADVYLMMVLQRPDVWPAADLALQEAARQLFDLPARPKTAELHALAEPWRPYRTAAAHLLWHYYLSERQKIT